jgi:EAL domain-containing protein (putative c-di-GMP-specific phosphodiesterase class I)
MNERVVRFLALERDLRRALEERELRLHYQPIVRLNSGAPVGAEALLRWPRADGSVTGPAQFIPVAEESGLIVPMGRWVLAQAAHQAAEWNRGRCAPFVVSINLSTRQFRDPGLREAVRAAIEGARIDPSLLRLEITESAVMHNLEEGTRLLRELKDLGVKLSVDDFGTGYSSLGYLKSFPIDSLKIDRSFVRDLPADRDSLAICRAVIALGRGMGVEVIAEGVETRVQARTLAADGCELAQGYLFGRPAEPETLRTSGRGRTKRPRGR